MQADWIQEGEGAQWGPDGILLGFGEIPQLMCNGEPWPLVPDAQEGIALHLAGSEEEATLRFKQQMDAMEAFQWVAPRLLQGDPDLYEGSTPATGSVLGQVIGYGVVAANPEAGREWVSRVVEAGCTMLEPWLPRYQVLNVLENDNPGLFNYMVAEAMGQVLSDAGLPGPQDPQDQELD
jgi:hypothetical protein